MAAARIGMRCHIYSDAETSPAAEVSANSLTGDYRDAEKLEAFAQDVDVITYEFENVPVETANLLESFKPVFPPPRALEVSQDRLEEKSFIRDLGIAVAPFAAVDDAVSMQQAVEQVGTPSILKTRRLGYDGKGQSRLHDASDTQAAHEQLGRVPSILEGMIKFDAEMSVLLVRGAKDETGQSSAVVAYDIPRNTHRDGILHQSIVPMDMDVPRAQCIEIATKIADALDYVGVLAVEMFLV
ncbi:MAG: ATP-grasp domain-containing protein, partial [Pseudomonadota bacterium]